MRNSIPLKTLSRFAHDAMSSISVARTLTLDLARDGANSEEHRAIATAVETCSDRIRTLQALIEALSAPASREEISANEFFAVARHAIPTLSKQEIPVNIAIDARTLAKFFAHLRAFLDAQRAQAHESAWTWTLPHPPTDSLDLALCVALAERSGLLLNLHARELTLTFSEQ